MPRDILTKIPPHSKESEMMVLGCMLTSLQGLNIAGDLLRASDFYFSEHQIIFQSLKNAYLSEKPADIHLIAEDLKRQEKLKEIGGVAYLTSLAQYAGTSVFIEEYAEIVRNKSILRRMIISAQEIEKTSLEDPEDVRNALDDAQQKFYAISQEANPSAGIELKDLLLGLRSSAQIPYLKEIEERQKRFKIKGNEGILTGMPTHFVDLDRLINGLSPSNLMILAARPAMGKTALAMNIAEHVCFKNNLPVGIFSLEMTAQQLLHRLICSQSEVESEKILSGSLNGVEFQQVVSCVNRMQQHSMIIDDQPGLKITDLRARARRMKEVHHIQFLVIDYLQLIFGSGSLRSVENRQNEISEISRMLKNLARELNIPVLCLSQLSRKVEERTGHRPMMSDLRESGSIEQDSDVVMFLLRADYYDPYNKPGLAELIVAKNRHGAVGSIQLAYRKEIIQFVNYTPEKSFAENNAAFEVFSSDSH
jgi:replicative DNA helicase